MEALHNTWLWCKGNWQKALLVIIPAAVLVTVVALAVQNRHAKQLLAQVEYYEILKMPDQLEKAKKLEEFVVVHEGSDIALLADMWLGAYYNEKGERENAVKFYDAVIKSESGLPMQYVAIDAVAPAYVELGKADLAAELYLDASDQGSNPNPHLYKFNAAAIYETAGETDKAKGIYEKLIADEKTPAEIKLKAEERILWLSASRG